MFCKKKNLIFYYILLFFTFNNSNCIVSYFLDKIENISTNSKSLIKNNFNKSLSLFSRIFNKFNNINSKFKYIYNNSKPVINDTVKKTINISYCSILAFYAVGFSIINSPKALLEFYKANKLLFSNYYSKLTDSIVNLVVDKPADTLSGVIQRLIENINNDIKKGKAGELFLNLGEKLNEGLEKLTVIKDFNSGYKKAVYLTTASLLSIVSSYFVFKYLYKSYNRPSLIIESSIESFTDKIRNFIFGKKRVTLDSMYYNKDLGERLSDIVKSVMSISESIENGAKNIKYNNLFLYGPPGVGKTMFAKELAKRSGMDYVLLSGAAFSQFKDGKGITEMNELFKWANKSSKGLLIIIDEADTFLYKREKMEPNSKEYQLLNNFLNHTGYASDKFMIVLCANYKDVMDEAVFSRIADYVKINLPDQKERQGVLILYRNKILLNSEENTQEFIDSVNKVLNDNKIKSIAKLTNNFSNRDLMYLINIIKTMANIKPEKVLTENIVDIAVERAIAKHNQLYNNIR